MRGSAAVAAARLLEAWLAIETTRVAIGVNTWEGVEYLDRDRFRELLAWAVRLDAIDGVATRRGACRARGSRRGWRPRPRQPATGSIDCGGPRPERRRHRADARPAGARGRRRARGRREAATRLPEQDPPQAVRSAATPWASTDSRCGR